MHFWTTFFVGFGIGSLAFHVFWIMEITRRIKRDSKKRMELLNIMASQFKDKS